MVKKITKSGKAVFMCEVCKFKYADKEWADKCQAWCEAHKSCNTEIIKHAVNG